LKTRSRAASSNPEPEHVEDVLEEDDEEQDGENDEEDEEEYPVDVDLMQAKRACISNVSYEPVLTSPSQDEHYATG
jgi:hypothetical protein